ncbi:hypothetical protein YA0721_11630 [Pseudomonas carnis]|uniref:hypothetical protein n=1 Tax=Pseudomonas carnis TaxID=2487355 RepID=UPI0018E63228|nr:hypothetical protein [Pseudomonas carnis]MBI6656088.1 hypothetical protein [Pseudomonas carnis]MBI6661713.1 hypothetical protein [Pseudomonas carnis]
MSNIPSYGSDIDDLSWGCTHTELLFKTSASSVKICHVKISDVQKIALELSNSVIDTSWMMSLDIGTRRSYQKTAAETAKLLVDIFESTASSSVVAGEFGELMVSIGSARALELIFDHTRIPIAELWKPQAKQNEGFDFHTTCTSNLINFGEAKYSSSATPHGNALSQASDFLEAEKHYRDRVHLINLVPQTAIDNLDNEKFGIIAAFSINAANPATIFYNALRTASEILSLGKITNIYLVGVSN